MHLGISAKAGVACGVLCGLVMQSKRLIEILAGASLFAAGCTCPDDDRIADAALASRAAFGQQIDACLASDADCAVLCRAVFELETYTDLERCVITATSPKAVSLEVVYRDPVECVGGRRPAGFVAPRAGSRAGAWLASIATVEAASVTAFARLVRALERLRAPARWIADA
nr:hypothetical protein [Deltaproteobacteria bacterium]